MTSPNHRLYPGIRRAAIAIVAVLLLVQLAPGPVTAGPDRTRKELQQARKRVDRIKDRLAAVEKQIETVQAQIRSLNVQISQATVQVEALQEAIHDTRKAKRKAERQGERLQSRLDQRARSVYIQGPLGALDLVLEADSLADLSNRLTFLEVLNRNDSDLAVGVEVERETLEESKANLEKYRRERKEHLRELTGKQEALQAKWDELDALESDYRADYAAARKEAKKLSKKLARELAAQYGFQGGGKMGPPPNADGPFYWCPVDPPRSYIDDFGYPRVGHTHQGNDIFAPPGTPIRAPFSGRAVEGYDGLGGIVVHVYSTQNGGDYVYNAHLIRHAGVNGQQVKPGDIIGFVGNTGNAVGTPPHDHFEYHPGGGSAVSPYVYLNEVCGTGGGG